MLAATDRKADTDRQDWASASLWVGYRVPLTNPTPFPSPVGNFHCYTDCHRLIRKETFFLKGPVAMPARGGEPR